MSAVPEEEGEETPLYKLARGLYNTGLLLLHDDKMDIGYTVYYNRPHIYNGRLVKDHPSPYHHWPFGMALMFGGQLLGTLDTLAQMAQGFDQEQEQDNHNQQQEQNFNNKQLVDYSSK